MLGQIYSCKVREHSACLSVCRFILFPRFPAHKWLNRDWICEYAMFWRCRVMTSAGTHCTRASLMSVQIAQKSVGPCTSSMVCVLWLAFKREALRCRSEKTDVYISHILKWLDCGARETSTETNKWLCVANTHLTCVSWTLMHVFHLVICTTHSPALCLVYVSLTWIFHQGGIRA